MLETLFIPEDELTPRILFDIENNIFEITGKSLPEDSDLFYRPVTEWVKKYITQPQEKTILCIDLHYFNSSSVRKVVDILILFEKILHLGKSVIVHWHYESGDDMMRDFAIDFQEVVKLPFVLIAEIEQ